MDSAGGSIRLHFAANRTKQYFFELQRGEVAGARVALRSQLFPTISRNRCRKPAREN
jgi:hypothetical protein